LGGRVLCECNQHSDHLRCGRPLHQGGHYFLLGGFPPVVGFKFGPNRIAESAASW
jgi:hypothetical protein